MADPSSVTLDEVNPSDKEIKNYSAALDATGVTKDEAKEYFLAWIAQTWCWGSGAAKRMEIEDLEIKASISAVLKTFVEYRTSAQEEAPYHHGTRFTMRGEGNVPELWDIPQPTVSFFADEVTKCDVPYTSEIKTCHRCHGRKTIECHACHGKGRNTCVRCRGSKKVSQDGETIKCTMCHGSGDNVCLNCGGKSDFAS